MQPSNIAPRHQNSFDALRLLFALLVMVTHSFALLRLPDPLEVLTGFRYDFGKFGVTGFFAISGYLVTKSWFRNPDPIRFVSARALRIFPAFWVALLVSVVVASLATVSASDFLSRPIIWRWVWRNALFVWRGFGALTPGAFEGNPFPEGANGSLWTLTYELHCYAVVLVLGMTSILARRQVMWGVLATLLLFYFKLIADGGSGIRLSYNDLYLAFGTGMLIAASGYLSSICMIAAACLCVALAQYANLPGDHWWYAPLQMTIGLGVVRLANSKALVHLAFRSGDYSYGLYVYAFPLQQLTIALLGTSASPLPVLLLSAAATFPLAIVSWHAVEKPALGWIGRIKVQWPFAARRARPGQS